MQLSCPQEDAAWPGQDAGLGGSQLDPCMLGTARVGQSPPGHGRSPWGSGNRCAMPAPAPYGELQVGKPRARAGWVSCFQELLRPSPCTGGGSTLLALCPTCREAKPGAPPSPASCPGQAASPPQTGMRTGPGPILGATQHHASPPWPQPGSSPRFLPGPCLPKAQLGQPAHPQARLGWGMQPRGRGWGQRSRDSFPDCVLLTLPLVPSAVLESRAAT